MSTPKVPEAEPNSEATATQTSWTLIDLLSSETACLPKRYAEDIEDYLAQLFQEYVNQLGLLSKSGVATVAVRNESETIRTLSNGLLLTLDQYLSGHTFEAFETFSRALEGVRHWLQSLVFPLGLLLGSPPSRQLPVYCGDLYRLRTGPLAQLSKKDLFHIPFEKRQLVASQRYSISGLPSLYLASSLWIAWEELGRPDFASLHAARFEGKGDLKVLDFGWSTSLAADLRLFGGDDAYGDSVVGQAIIWPLKAACSLVRRYPGTAFVPEYIIPQFLLQWVQREKDLDGIRYFSTKLAAMGKAQNRAFNFVFPVRQKATTGICGGLQDSFALTPPISWPMLQSWKPNIMAAERSGMGALELAEGFSVLYSDTEFFALEHKMKGGLKAVPIVLQTGSISNS